jgi:lipopolysaccharide transport system permease protein
LTTLGSYFRIIDELAKTALRADASRYMFGYIWWILEPLLYVAVFYVVFGIVLESNRADFLVFLMCGKLSFIWFSKTVNQASNSIVKNKGLIGKIDIAKSIFPMSVVQESLYKQAAVFTLLVGVLLVKGYAITGTYIWLLPLLLVNYLMIVVCSLVGAYAVCVIKDFAMVIPLCMTFLLFTSGIFWDVRDLGDAHKTELVLTVNPVAFIIDAYRQILMHDTPPDLIHLSLLGAVLTVMLAATLFLMHKTSQYLALKALTS